MTPRKKIKKRKQLAKADKRPGPKPAVIAEDLEQVEFHRTALALLPYPDDPRPGIAYFVKNDPASPETRFCSCQLSKKHTCPHILRLAEIYKLLKKRLEGRGIGEDFRSSIWYSLARILADDPAAGKDRSVNLRHVSRGDERSIRVCDSEDREILSYLSIGPDSLRFIERCIEPPHEKEMPMRMAVLEKLKLLTLTENERTMSDMGFKTRGQAIEESFWHRMAYHCYREFGTDCTFHPAIEEATGSFTVTCRRSGEIPVLRMIIPRQKVRWLLNTFKERLPNQHDLPIHPVPLKSIFKVSMNTELDLEVMPVIRLIQENGEEKFIEQEALERFRYGDLVYIKELGILAELEKPGSERRFKAPVKMVLKQSQIPGFLADFGEELQEGPHILDANVRALKIFRHIDRVEITPEAIERDWCWLSVKYGFGNSAISLAELMDARKSGQRFINTPDGWVDSRSGDLAAVTAMFPEEAFDGKAGTARLSRLDLFRIKAASVKPIEIKGDDEKTRVLNRILELRPSDPLPPLEGMRSALRAYQRLGTEWISFLFENGFGGLLCDDMGLGKTHQAMAFMLFLQEHKGIEGPFLVVCPTTVLSHWNNKLREHAPNLGAAVYYGGDRDLEAALNRGGVLLTSYGILRRDVAKLKKRSFPLAVFDEIQHIKNPETQVFQAARDVRAGMKLGLTGTPIENTLRDLKTLMDLTVPGYLGSDERFSERYIHSDRPYEETESSQELSRLIAPFTLRRMKKTVLSELPEKIEDIRICSLSEDQIKLYRDAIATRGQGIVEILRGGKAPVPYMHIFALLTLLKQICNHPSIVEGEVEDYERYQSGKWELFKELLSEIVDSGQKVVIYSQFLKMIGIMERYLKTQDVGFVTLTGASRNRGEIIRRFNEDPDCRVYLGSLKAGGTGIDLVAASVVIHYDRWWNAAREDQATDRVHRIGQRRGVQVFKLVTEGTLEEKISAIIEKKRNLMDSVVREDDPALLKTFSRDELIEMLGEPAA